MNTNLFIKLFLTFVVIVSAYIFYLQNEKDKLQLIQATKQPEVDTRLPSEWNTRTKSFDSERAISREFKFMAEPDKCFDCTNQVARNFGTEYAIYEQPTKLFSMGSL